MKIAVIGANGLVGSRVVEMLHLAQEHAVVPIVRTPASLGRATRFNLEWRIADARDSLALRSALRSCDAVVHAASGSGRDREKSAASLCTAAAAVGMRRLVYLSDASVHGAPPEAGSNEHSPLHTTNNPPEIAQRILAERTFFQRCKRLQLEGVALRPTIVYGPRCAWFAALARDLREGRAGWVDEGRGIFNGIYVDNLVSAIFSALAAPAAATGKPYLIGDEETLTWREFYLATAKLLGVSGRRIASIAELPPALTDSRAPLRRIASLSGVKAVAPVVPRGVKRLAKYLLATGSVPADAWTPRPPAGPSITRELALLQQCRWRFPHKRAGRALGFHPTVAFAEGLNRTLAWLAFAGGDTAMQLQPEPANSHRPLQLVP